MYYSFYMNEKLLLDNWDYYDEVNLLLTYLLCKDRRKNIDEKLDFYFKHRHERKNSVWYDFYYDEEEYFKEEYDKYLYRKDMYKNFFKYGGVGNNVMTYHPFKENNLFKMYEDEIHKKDKDRRKSFERRIHKCNRMNIQLREINEVVIYQSDIDAIDKARKEYNLTESQTQLLFGLIFFSRMNNSKWCRIGTNFKFKSFKACFEKSISNNDIETIRNIGLFKNKYINQGKQYNIDYDWEYLNFDNKDKVAYTFKTTLENNKLNLTALAKEVIPNYKKKYCYYCECEFTPNSNSQYMCCECKKIIVREQARLRKQRQRQREKGL